MTVVYGVISYISIALLIVGYFLVKKWGDKVDPPLVEEPELTGGVSEDMNT